MRTIILTQGLEATVDEEDYAFLTQWKWHASKVGKTVYAMRYTPMCGGKRQHLYMHAEIARRCGFVAAEVDHRDRNGLNNCRSNLRQATTANNAANRGMLKNNTSGAKGVRWDANRKRWLARVRVRTGDRNRTVDRSKMFDTFAGAVEWRDVQAGLLHGEYAYLNTAVA